MGTGDVPNNGITHTELWPGLRVEPGTKAGTPRVHLSAELLVPGLLIAHWAVLAGLALQRGLPLAGWIGLVLAAVACATVAVAFVGGLCRERCRLAHRLPELEGRAAGLEERLRDRTDALEASEAHQRALWSSAPLAMILLDPNANCVRSNARWCELSGLEPEECHGRGWLAALGEEAAGQVRQKLSLLEPGEPQESLLLVRHGTGTVRECRARWAAFDQPEGSGRVFAVFLEDVSEQRCREAQLRHLTGGAHCLLWQGTLVECEGLLWRNLHVTDERAAQEFLALQVAPGERYADAWRQARLAEDRALAMQQALEALHAGRATFSQEYRVRLADGAVRWISEHVLAEPVASGAWKAFGVCTDITEQKSAVTALERAKEAAEASSRTKGELLSSIGRELRAPVDGILRLTDQALRTDLTREQRDSLQPVVTSAQALLALVDRVLESTVHETGEASTAAAAPDLAEVVQRVREATLRREAASLQEASRALGRALAGFEARAVMHAAYRLELMGRSGDLKGAEEALSVLEAELQRLPPGSDQLTRKGTPSTR